MIGCLGKVLPRKLTWQAGTSTMNEPIFSVENGDVPHSHVSFQGGNGIGWCFCSRCIQMPFFRCFTRKILIHVDSFLPEPWHVCLTNVKKTLDKTKSQVFDLLQQYYAVLICINITLQETNISPKNGILKMIFLFPRWDMLIPWRVCHELMMA